MFKRSLLLLTAVFVAQSLNAICPCMKRRHATHARVTRAACLSCSGGICRRKPVKQEAKLVKPRAKQSVKKSACSSCSGGACVRRSVKPVAQPAKKVVAKQLTRKPCGNCVQKLVKKSASVSRAKGVKHRAVTKKVALKPAKKTTCHKCRRINGCMMCMR